MFGYENISLNLAYPAIYFFAALILIGGYTFFIYRFTIPPVSKMKKGFLVSIRVLVLLIILLIFFEPVLSFTNKIILGPVNLIFFDNSRSITIDDGTNRKERAKKISEILTANPFTDEDEFYLYGESVRQIDKDSLSAYDFSDAITNNSDVFAAVKTEKKNYASIILVTDGVINSGSNSLNPAKNLGLPVFTIGLGDTSQTTDVWIKRVLNNDLLYAETPVTIETSIRQSGLNGKNVLLSLFENNKLVEQKSIVLNNSGIQSEFFIYTPQTSGEKKLSIELSRLSGELSSANNRKVFYVSVLSNKVRVLLLAGSPSADLTFIKNTLREDDNFTVKSLTQVSTDKYAESGSGNFIDSADVFFLIGFPSSTTGSDLLNRVNNRILIDKIPFFILISEYTDLNKLNLMQPELPVTIRYKTGGIREVQPQIFKNQDKNPVIQNNSTHISAAWNDLPPVYQSPFEYISKPGSEIIATVRLNNNVSNSPLLISRSFSGKRSIAVLASNIWRWKLQSVRKNNNIFDSFIINSVKWLNTSDLHKRVNIKSSKKNYSPGEMIEFSAQVYDKSLNPVPDADVKINIVSDNDSYELNLQSKGNGIYEGNIRINTKGDFKYTGLAKLSDEVVGNDDGVFNVGDLDIEMINPKMDYDYLNLLANETNGSFAFAENYSDLFKQVRALNEKAVKEKIITSDFTLWSDEWLMMIVILLFSFEWFFRKRAGML
jgi:hypothetical protein